MSSRRFGKRGAKFLVAGVALGWIGKRLIVFGDITGLRHHLSDRPALRLVAIQQRRLSGALVNKRELPCQIDRVLQARIHAVPFRGRAEMSRIAGEQYRPRSETARHLSMAAEPGWVFNVNENRAGFVEAN